MPPSQTPNRNATKRRVCMVSHYCIRLRLPRIVPDTGNDLFLTSDRCDVKIDPAFNRTRLTVAGGTGSFDFANDSTIFRALVFIERGEQNVRIARTPDLPAHPSAAC